MKKFTIVLISLIAIALFAGSPYVYTNSGQAPAGQTGAPGEGNCAQCHSGAAASGQVELTFPVPLTELYFDSTYLLSFSINHPGAVKYGFSLTALSSSNSKAGDISIVNAANTQLQTQSGKQYLGHKTASSNSSWQFNWKAPSSSSGISSVTFNYSANASNGNSATSGDAIYTASAAITLANPPTSVNELAVSEAFRVYFSPEESALIVDGNEINQVLNVFSLSGQLIESHRIGGKAAISTFGWTKGIYLISIQSDKKVSTHKVLVY